MKKNTILELKNIQKVYENGFQAIFGMNLEIKKGEFVVFVGPSGCGKSTTIRMIAGLEKISTGELILDNRNATDLPPRKRNIAMVFQNYALFPHLTVKENMTFTLKTKRVPRDIIEKKIKWAAEILELKYLLNRKPAQLSGGQRQRVALGRAIVAEPTLFLMDEPLSNLDAKLRSVMRTTIRKLHDQLKTTSIYVTHDQVEAMTMADKIVVMSNGFIQQVGTPEEIFTIPANTFVASFVGTPSINMIKTFKTKSDNLSFKVAEKEYNFSIKGKKIIRNKTSKEVLLGIRPQHIKQVKKTTKGALEYIVDHIEMLGAETIVFTKEKLEYVCPTEEKPEAGKKVYLQFPIEKIQLFDESTGISLINPINEPTMNSIKTFLKSADLIQKRTALLESFKNKKANSSLYEKIHKFIINTIWPQELLLNPVYSEILEKRREIKINQRDAIRRRATTEINKYKADLLKLDEQIKKEKTQIMKDLPLIRKFQKYPKKLIKVESLIKLKKKIVDEKTFIELKRLIRESKEIKELFEKNLFYDIKKIKKFNNDFQKMFNKK